jgi:hypothetical protein
MTAPLAFREGYGVFGTPIMKFTLTFDGELPSNGKVRDKWEIRKQFHPQLQELWRVHSATQEIVRHRRIPAQAPYLPVRRHHSAPPYELRGAYAGETIDLCEEVEKGGRKFLPLVRERLGLRCGLKITFLRKEEPGRVYQGGDMDNRLKTLFDALSVPTAEQVANDPTIEDPIYCLLEDDGLIAGLNIETHRLLSRPNSTKHEVHLLVEVDVRVTHPRAYNEPFLGD